MDSHDQHRPPSRLGVIELTKHHGLGNDFLIALDPKIDIGAAEAMNWCNRRTGIGADGLIVASPVAGARTDDHRWTMVLWNADGGRAEISGNGIRCLGQAIGLGMATAGFAPLEGELELHIETDVGLRLLTVYPSTGDTWQVRAEMGKVTVGPGPSSAWGEVGIVPDYQQGVDVGNPHVVAIVDREQYERADIATVGPVIEAGYPGGINVHVVAVTSDRTLDLKVWERGVGVTQACGSGACAAAWAAHRENLVGSEISVTMPGGSATVELVDDEAYLIGPATLVGSIRIA